MLSDARDILQKAASVDPTLVEDARQSLQRFAQRIAGLARTFKHVWTALTVALVMAGIGFAIQFHHFDESRAWTIACVVTFLLLALLGGATAYAFALVTGLPAAIDSLANSAQDALANARDHWSVVSQANGIGPAVRALWAAGKLVHSLRRAKPDLTHTSNAFAAIALMANPLLWLANASLAAASLLVPMVFALIALVRYLT